MFSLGTFLKGATKVAPFLPIPGAGFIGTALHAVEGASSLIGHDTKKAVQSVINNPIPALAIGGGVAAAAAVGSALVVHHRHRSSGRVSRFVSHRRRRARPVYRRKSYKHRSVRHNRKHNRMPAALKRYWATHRRHRRAA